VVVSLDQQFFLVGLSEQLVVGAAQVGGGFGQQKKELGVLFGAPGKPGIFSGCNSRPSKGWPPTGNRVLGWRR